MNVTKLINESRHARGTSKAALERKAKRERGIITPKPGETSYDSRGRAYFVRKDGSLCRIVDFPKAA